MFNALHKMLHDAMDTGAADRRHMWEITATTGRRIGEVLQIRWDCLGRDGGLPAFWMTRPRSGDYDAAIRIRAAARRYRRAATRPSTASSLSMVTDPSATNAPPGKVPDQPPQPRRLRRYTYQWFHSRIRD